MGIWNYNLELELEFGNYIQKLEFEILNLKF